MYVCVCVCVCACAAAAAAAAGGETHTHTHTHIGTGRHTHSPSRTNTHLTHTDADRRDGVYLPVPPTVVQLPAAGLRGVEKGRGRPGCELRARAPAPNETVSARCRDRSTRAQLILSFSSRGSQDLMLRKVKLARFCKVRCTLKSKLEANGTCLKCLSLSLSLLFI